MPEKERVFVPSRLYDIQIKIKDLDYTSDLYKLSIISSLSSAYISVILTLNIDPNDVIIEEVFGGEPVKLFIRLNRENPFAGNQVEIESEFMYVSSSFPLTMKDKTSRIIQKDRVKLEMVTIARKPYKIMNTLVNQVYIGKKLKEIIEDLVEPTGAKLQYDTNYQNENVINQVCIPPTTLYNIIKEYDMSSDDIFNGFLDQRFGLFDGAAGVFCINDKIYIKNLSERLKLKQAFTIYELASNDNPEDFKKIMDEATKGNTFYTYDPISTDYSGNAKYAKFAIDMRYIVRPNNTITTTIQEDLRDIARNYSLFHREKGLIPKLYIDKETQRTRYYNEDSGYNKDKSLFTSRFSRILSNTATLSINIERNLPILNLLNVGDCVKFKPRTIEYMDLKGKYILWSSQVDFVNNGNWESTCTVNLTRTNKKA